MDEFAALGALIISGGTGAAPVLHVPVHNQDAASPPIYSEAEQTATDALFTAQAPEEQTSFPVAAMVVSAGIANLKGVVIDQARKETADEEDEEEERPHQPRLHADEE